MICNLKYCITAAHGIYFVGQAHEHYSYTVLVLAPLEDIALFPELLGSDSLVLITVATQIKWLE